MEATINLIVPESAVSAILELAKAISGLCAKNGAEGSAPAQVKTLRSAKKMAVEAVPDSVEQEQEQVPAKERVAPDSMTKPKTYKVEDVRALAGEKARIGFRDEVIAILDKAGVKSISELPPLAYADVMRDLNELI